MVPDCRFASLVWCVSLVLGLWNPPGWAQPLPLVLIVGWVTQGKLLGGRESVLWMWTAPLCGPDSYLTVLCLGPRQKNAGNDSPTWSGVVGGGGATRARVCSPPALGSRRLIWGCSEPQLFVCGGRTAAPRAIVAARAGPRASTDHVRAVFIACFTSVLWISCSISFYF